MKYWSDFPHPACCETMRPGTCRRMSETCVRERYWRSSLERWTDDADSAGAVSLISIVSAAASAAWSSSTSLTDGTAGTGPGRGAGGVEDVVGGGGSGGGGVVSAGVPTPAPGGDD